MRLCGTQMVTLDWVSGDTRNLPDNTPIFTFCTLRAAIFYHCDIKKKKLPTATSFVGCDILTETFLHCCDIFQPGLTGGTDSSYVRHMLVRARSKGWRVVVFNSRGCADSPVTTPQVLPLMQNLIGIQNTQNLMERRYTLPLLEQTGFETWAIDILGWGFSNLEKLPLCNVESKRDHLYQINFWKSYIGRSMVLVGSSLGAAVAIDFAINHPEAVDKLILIDASVYEEGTGSLSRLPKFIAYAGASLLKSLPLRVFATNLTFNSVSFNTCLNWTRIGRLHCLLPWWDDATVDFMNSGGYNVTSQISQVPHKALIIWGEDDQIIDSKHTWLHCELSDIALMVEFGKPLGTNGKRSGERTG